MNIIIINEWHHCHYDNIYTHSNILHTCTMYFDFHFRRFRYVRVWNIWLCLFVPHAWPPVLYFVCMKSAFRFWWWCWWFRISIPILMTAFGLSIFIRSQINTFQAICSHFPSITAESTPNQATFSLYTYRLRFDDVDNFDVRFYLGCVCACSPTIPCNTFTKIFTLSTAVMTYFRKLCDRHWRD